MTCQNDDNLKPAPLNTTIGELSAALFDAARAEFGNARIAHRVASEALRDMLNRARANSLERQVALQSA
jgi:hypothetical protein